MFYGQGPTDHDAEIAKRMQEYLYSLPLDDRGQRPYIERQWLRQGLGVWIRRIGHYPGPIIDKIVSDYDAIHAAVIGSFDE